MENRLGIIVAQKEEAEAIIKKFNMELDTVENVSIYSSRDFAVSLVVTGVGMLNASYALRVLLNNYPTVSRILNVGVVAGRGNTSIREIVSVHEAYNGDSDLRKFNHAQYYVPEIGDAIISFPISFFLKDDLPIRKLPCYSISYFLDRELESEYEDYIVDMEYYGIAHTCYKEGILHHAIKVISDTSAQESKEEYEENLAGCCEELAEFLVDSLEVEVLVP